MGFLEGEMVVVKVANGKYTVLVDNHGGLTALLHGEPWRDCHGDKLIYNLAIELHEARRELKQLVKELVVKPEEWFDIHADESYELDPHSDEVDPTE